MNLLLISFDTLRSDVAYSGKFPTINRLLRRGTTFSTAVASAPLTPLSHASVLSGLHPPNHGLRHLFKQKLNDEVPLIAETLLDAGYRTGAIVSCPGLNSWYGFNRGFESYDDEIPLLEDGSDPLQTVDVKLRGTALKRADIVADRAIDWVSAAPDEDFFLFLHFFDSHWPYEAPDTFGQDHANGYEGEVAFMDHHLGRFLDWLDETGHSDQTAIVFFSDHGEDLEGWYPNDKAGSRGYEEEEGHGALLFDQTQLVALSVSNPGILPENNWINDQVRLIDIAPTILDLCGVQASGRMDGTSLRPLIDGKEHGHRPAYFETFYREEIRATRTGPATFQPQAGVRIDDRWKIIWETADLAAGVKVFDLHQDPGEWRPHLCVAETHPDVPDFAPEPMDNTTLLSALAPAEGRMAGLVPLMGIIDALSKKSDIGLRLSLPGSFDGFTSLPEVRLDLVFPIERPGTSISDWVHNSIHAIVPVTAAVQDTSSTPLRCQFVCEVPRGALRLKVTCFGPADVLPEDPQSHVLRKPAGQMPNVRREPRAEFDLKQLRNKLLIWGVDVTASLKNAQFIDAIDTLGKIRSRILTPVLHQLAYQAQATIDASTIEQEILSCMPIGTSRSDLITALKTTVDRARSGLEQLAVQRGETVNSAEGDDFFARVSVPQPS